MVIPRSFLSRLKPEQGKKDKWDTNDISRGLPRNSAHSPWNQIRAAGPNGLPGQSGASAGTHVGAAAATGAAAAAHHVKSDPMTGYPTHIHAINLDGYQIVPSRSTCRMRIWQFDRRGRDPAA